MRTATQSTVGKRRRTANEDVCLAFPHPFNELFVWAVLTKRQAMALCLWQHGEEALAKALIASKLYKSLAKEAADDYIEVEVCDSLELYSESVASAIGLFLIEDCSEFRRLSLELLDQCYHEDELKTLQLLTYELANWGEQTCLSLAVIANNKEFLSHPCCQIVLSDLWHGGLRIRRHSNLKVLIGLFFPPFIVCLDFKTNEEQRQVTRERDAKGVGGP
jgi:transient receptor potential cation channel subfamily M protein 3